MRSSSLRWLAVLLAIVGVAALVVGIIYLVIPAHSLPHFLGQIKSAKGHRTKRAVAGIVAGLLLLAASAVSAMRARRRHHRY